LKHFCSLSYEEVVELFNERNEKPFRAKQLFYAVYKKFLKNYSSITTLSKSFRQYLEEKTVLSSLKLLEIEESKDMETKKFLWQLSDGYLVESVLICSGNRRTVCVSSQVGCRARCSFCASGKKGFIRDLSSGEIIEQVLQIYSLLHSKNERVTHIVFMGMGEPLENYFNVVKAVRILICKEGFDFSKRRITISTVGIVEGIRKLIKENLKINLVLSLHAPNQEIRRKLIPYAKKYSLSEIMEAVNEYAVETKRNITYEYILISQINDQYEHANQLAILLKNKDCCVNLIPYNPIEALKFKRPDFKQIKNFQFILKKNKIVCTCRYTKGKDIRAACGQLLIKN